MSVRKTKIIATVGPAILKPRIMDQLLRSSVDVLRFNFSHLSPDSALEQLKLVRSSQRRTGIRVCKLADLKGPEVRTDDQTYSVKKDKRYWFVYGQGDPQNDSIGIDHRTAYSLVKKGQKLVLDDGYSEMIVEKTVGKKFQAICLASRVLKPRRSVSFPRLDLHLPILGPEDRQAIDFAIREKMHWIAASFIRSSKDVEEIRMYMKKKGKQLPIISKIETFSAIQNIDEIVEASEGIMIARGDLGMEFDYEEIPLLQDLIISKATEKGKVVIVATQMLESMLENTVPKRAEVTDIALAAREKVDAVMLSAETAAGKYPLEAFKVMARVIEKNEESAHYRRFRKVKTDSPISSICQSALYLSSICGARYLVCISESGMSPAIIAANRSSIISVVTTENEEILARCRLYYSIYPIVIKRQKLHTKEIRLIIDLMKKRKMVQVGDNLVIVFSLPYEDKKDLTTNTVTNVVVGS